MQSEKKEKEIISVFAKIVAGRADTPIFASKLTCNDSIVTYCTVEEVYVGLFAKSLVFSGSCSPAK